MGQLSPEDLELWSKVTETVSPLKGSSLTFVACRHLDPERQCRSRSSLDLHGLALQYAHEECLRFTKEARHGGLKSVTIITGASGSIRKEFPTWMELDVNVKTITDKNGGGSFTVVLQK